MTDEEYYKAMRGWLQQQVDIAGSIFDLLGNTNSPKPSPTSSLADTNEKNVNPSKSFKDQLSQMKNASNELEFDNDKSSSILPPSF